ncbi:MAG: adenylate cyclase regulatory domain-containing protein [Solirubrobacteraceae bacterium]
MATDFAAEGLLDGLEGEARTAREELLRVLEDEGVALEDMRSAAGDGRLMFLLAERAVGGTPHLTAREVSERTGLPLERLTALRRAQGLPAPEPDARVFSDTDLEAARNAIAFEEAGVPFERQLPVVRVLGRGLGQAAEAMRATVLELVLEPGASEADLARSYGREVEELMPLLGPALDQLLRIHLRQMVRTEAISAAERLEGSLPGAREVSVAFADLVGFTRLGEEVPPDELGRVATRLGDLTGDTVHGEVRLVKMIGDAAMLTAPAPGELLDVALDLVAAADAEGDDFPQLRVGVACGEALRRAGDWYGRPVNLASRITAIARPGSVLTTREVRDAAREDYSWSAAGRRTIKGVDGPVRLYRARRPEPEGEGEGEAA